MTVAFILLLLIGLPLWAALVAGSFSLHESDPAGNALGHAFTAMYGIAVWVILGVLVLMAAGRRGISFWPGMAAVVLLPASAVAGQKALARLARDRDLRWPAVLLAVIPALLLAYAVISYFPPLRFKFDPTTLAIGVWSAVAVLIPLPWIKRAEDAVPARTPEQIAQDEARREAERRQQRRDTFGALTPASSFAEWWSFTEDPEFREAAFQGARGAVSRQAEVEWRLEDASRRLFIALPDLDLAVTPALHQAARAFLADQVRNLRPCDPEHPMATSVVTEWFACYLPVLRWFATGQSHFDAEIAAMETAVSGYPDSPERGQFVAALRALRSGG